MSSALPPTLTALLLAATTSSAAITIPTVSVGDAGNAADPATGNEYGDVAYEYQIGKHEVTNSQYTAFLNDVAKTDTNSLYNSNMGTSPHGGISQSGSSGSFSYTTRADMANKPVNFVSFWDATRFANWLTNGQPTGAQGNGTTENGAYTLTSSGISNNTVTRGDWYDLGVGNTSGGTVFAVASGDEWYKAAYYDGNDSYYTYPTQSDQAPTAENPPGGTNSANYDEAVGSVTDVGAYSNSSSHYGTFDQGGNVKEWNDEIASTTKRVRPGGSFANFDTSLQSSNRFAIKPSLEFNSMGFRVSSLAPIPEPSSYGAIFGIVGLAAAVFFRRRRRRE